MNINKVSWVCAAALFASPLLAQNFVTAMVGVQIRSGAATKAAQARNSIAATDRLRVYVKTVKDSVVYVVVSDGSGARLLAGLDGNPRMPGEVVVLPSSDGAYPVAPGRRRYTIICSEKPVPDMRTQFGSGAATAAAWSSLEKKLADQGKLLSDTTEKPPDMAAKMRAMEDPFVKQLMRFSGNGILVKSFEFDIQ